MIPGMNPRQMNQMMKKMGIKQQELPAVEVIIRLEDKEIVIPQPQVSKVNMMGQETYQITGEEFERPLEEADATPDISDEDVATVVEQTGKSEEEAREAIVEASGDLAEAIMKLSE